MIRVITVLCLLAMPISTQEANRCAPRDFFVDQLAERYGEHLVAQGRTAGLRMIEVFVSGDRSTWTILVTTPTGSCMVASGEDWRTVEPSLDQEGEDM